MKGQSLIELLLVIGLTAIILPAILTGLVASRSGKVQQNLRLDAVTLLKEAQEAVRNVREKDWNTFAVNGTFHPEIAVNNSWSLIANPETVNGFTRQVVISDVNRDPITGAIVLTGGTLDPSTKKVVTTVSWSTPTPSSVTSTTYIARLDNITYTETLKAQFDAGTKTGVAVTNTSGGEIILGSGGQGDWCNPPVVPTGELDLPKNGVANAISAIEGRVFAGTGENASGVSLANVDVTNASSPNILGTVNGYKTNDVFIESTSYGYIATDTNSAEVVVIDLSTYLAVGSFNTPGPTDAESVFVSGNTGYVTAGNTLYNFDVSNKTSPSALDLDGVTLAGTGNRVVVVGTYAYVATSNASTPLQIINLTNATNLAVEGQLSALNDKEAVDVYLDKNGDGTRAYVVTAASGAQKEFFIIDTSSKTSPQPVSGGSYEANGMDPKGVTVVTGGKAIIVGTGGEEYQVINFLNNESNPTYCGGIQIDTGVNAVSSVLESGGNAYSYIVSGDASQELKIYAGGPGGQYAADGTFESQTIPIPMPVNETSFNRFEVNVNRPSQTDIKFQVAVAKAVAGSCSGASFTFVGPDGTNSTFFTTTVTSGTQAFDYAIPTAINPGQCFRYKMFLSTSNSSQTPIFYDITVNYAP